MRSGLGTDGPRGRELIFSAGPLADVVAEKLLAMEREYKRLQFGILGLHKAAAYLPLRSEPRAAGIYTIVSYYRRLQAYGRGRTYFLTTAGPHLRATRMSRAASVPGRCRHSTEVLHIGSRPAACRSQLPLGDRVSYGFRALPQTLLQTLGVPQHL